MKAESKRIFHSLFTTLSIRNSISTFCIICFLVLFSLNLKAQTSINTIGVPFAENFDGMAPSVLTLPSSFKISNAASATDYATGLTSVTRVAGLTGTNALTNTSTGAAYQFANGDSAVATDRAIGFLNSASYASTRSILYAFTNNTGSTISTLTVSWNYEKYRSGIRAWTWNFFHGNTSSPATAATSGDSAYVADANNTTVAYSSGVKNVTLNGLSIPSGTTYYLRWTLTGVGGSSNGQALGIDNFSITLSNPVSSTPSVSITSANPAVAAAIVSQGSVNNVLYNATVAVANASATLNTASFTPTGTYVSGTDVTNLKLWYSSSGTFSAASSTLVGTATPPASGVSQSYTAGVALPVGTYYLYLTADISCGATAGNTIAINQPTAANFSFATITPTVAAFAGGTQTITASSPNMVTAAAANSGNTIIQTSWTNPATCYDEIVIFATNAASFSATPSGNGTGYTANAAYGSGTAMGNAFCVYKGSVSPQTITNLVNGTLYNIAIYTRKGSTWSSPVLLSATPFAGANGDYRTKASGTWDATTTWEKMVGGAWVASPDYPNFSGSTVTILSGHTVVVNTSPRAVLNLNVNAGGKVWTNSPDTVSSNNKYITLYGNVVCEGTIGNGTTYDALGLNIGGVNDTITGSGSISLVRLRKLATSTQVTTNLIVNADVRLYWVPATGSGAMYNACTAVANAFNVTLNAGKTITTNGVICIDGVNGQQVGSDAYGTFTINGTLNVGTIYFTCNNAAYSPAFVIGSTGVINAVNVSMAQSLGSVPHILTINTGGRLNVTGTAGITPFSTTNNTYNFALNSNVEFSAAGNQPVQAGLPYSNLIISGTGIKTATGNLNVGNILYLNSSAYSQTGITTTIGDGGTVTGNGGNLDAGAAGGTISFAGNGTINGTTPLTFYNLNTNAGNVNQLLNNCNGQFLNLTGGTFTIGTTNQFNMLSGGTVNAVAGNFATGPTGGILNFPGTGSFTGSCSPYNVYISGGVDFGVGTVTIQNGGRLRINTGGWVNTNGVFYANGSTLEYNNGAPFYTAGTEWYGGVASGRGVPFHVQVGVNTVNGTNLVLTGGTWRQLNGNMYIGPASGGSGYGLTLSSTIGGDLKIGGDWYRTGATSIFNPNNRAVFFIGTAGNQTINMIGGGTETYAYLIINKPSSQSMVLQSSPATNVTLTGGASGGNSLLLFNGNIDLNGRTFNFNPYTNSFQNNIAIEGTAGNFTRNINSSVPGGIFNIYSNDATTQRISNVVRSSANASLLAFGANTSLIIGGIAQNSGINFGPGYTTINGNLQINTWGYVDINPPFYGVNSNLIYNSGGAYKRYTEWNATTGAGYPYNIIVQNSTNLRVNDDNIPVNTGGNGTADRALAGSLNILPTGILTLGDSTENNKLTIGLDFNLNGTINMPSTTTAIGADLYVGRNWNRTATGIFNHNERAVFFNSSLDGTITASGGQYFPYVYLQKTALNNKLSLLDDISIGKEFSINSGSFDLAAKDATLLSNTQATARFGKVGPLGDVLYSGAGRFVVERYLPTGSGPGQHGKSWQFLATPATGTQTIKQAWQEGATIANQNLVSGYGTQITSNNGGSQAGAEALGFDVYTPTGPSMKVFNSLGVWNGVANTNIPIYNQKGYMVFVRGDRSVTTFNAPATSTKLRTRGKLFVPNSNPIPTSFIPAGKFEAIGNPHASAVDFTFFDKTDYPDVDNAFYVWDPLLVGTYGYGGYQLLSAVNGDFLPTPGGTANYPTGVPCRIIQSGQAILMHSTGNGGYVRIPDSAKVAGSALTFRVPTQNAPRQYLRIYIHVANTAQTLADGVTAVFSTDFTNRYDANDAVKLNNSAENLSLKCGDKMLALEARNRVFRTDTLQLMIGNMRRQNYQLRFAPEAFDSRMNIRLIDRYTQLSHNISTSDSTFVDFTVNTDAGSYAADRFIVVIGRASGAQNNPLIATVAKTTHTLEKKNITSNENLSIFPNPIIDGVAQLHFNNIPAGSYNINITNSSGQIVLHQILKLDADQKVFSLPLKNITSGMYQLTLLSTEKSYSSSLMVD